MMDTKYTPFNGLKALVHLDYWKPIVENKRIPFPRFLSIDPCGICNYTCTFCNSSKIMSQHSKQMDKKIIDEVRRLLAFWKTKAACIGGGGEPLLNPCTSYLINELLKLKIEIGVVTNGTHIDKHLDALSKCKWVGVSLDAGTKNTYIKIKGAASDQWDLVRKNIKSLSGKKVEVAWKFLIHPDNYMDIYAAVREAKNCGCNLIHLRPGAYPWFYDQTDKSFKFTKNVIKKVKLQIENARKDFESETFRVFYLEDKFTGLWQVKKTFSKCYAVFTTCFIDAQGKIGLCCDRRGDQKIILGNLKNIKEKWGSQDHWKIHNHIQVKSCPRCTMAHVNEIFKNVIIKDKLYYNMY